MVQNTHKKTFSCLLRWEEFMDREPLNRKRVKWGLHFWSQLHISVTLQQHSILFWTAVTCSAGEQFLSISNYSERPCWTSSHCVASLVSLLSNILCQKKGWKRHLQAQLKLIFVFLNPFVIYIIIQTASFQLLISSGQLIHFAKGQIPLEPNSIPKEWGTLLLQLLLTLSMPLAVSFLLDLLCLCILKRKGRYQYSTNVSCNQH